MTVHKVVIVKRVRKRYFLKDWLVLNQGWILILGVSVVCLFVFSQNLELALVGMGLRADINLYSMVPTWSQILPFNLDQIMQG